MPKSQIKSDEIISLIIPSNNLENARDKNLKKRIIERKGRKSQI